MRPESPKYAKQVIVFLNETKISLLKKHIKFSAIGKPKNLHSHQV